MRHVIKKWPTMLFVINILLTITHQTKQQRTILLTYDNNDNINKNKTDEQQTPDIQNNIYYKFHNNNNHLLKPTNKDESNNNSNDDIKADVVNIETNKENESRKLQINNINLSTLSESYLHLQNSNNKFNKDVHKRKIVRREISIRKNQQNFTTAANDDNNNAGKKIEEKMEQRELEDAMEYGLKAMQELLEIKEPKWYQMGLYLDQNDPASHVAAFGTPNKKTIQLTNLGYAALEASRKLAEAYPENVSRQSPGFLLQSRLLLDECPLRGNPRCSRASRRYRTADGTCNNFKFPWRGSSLLPMQRFLPPVYEDGIQSIRRSVLRGGKLPSPRDISTRVHRDKNHELPTITLMFMQWGQFIDHDITSAPKSRSFNGSVPRCCIRGGRNTLPPDLMHPNCLPIEVSDDDWFLGQFGIRCLEFIRSAPSTRINCDLGWREQLNQVTSYLDGSAIYGSDIETSDSIRTFRNGKLQYGRPQGREPLQPPDPPGGELCRSGALTSDCFQSGDGRISEQPGLLALHTTWLRYHNRLATILGQLNNHWSDEKIYQETRRIIVALIQHITYREFLPITLGQEVMELFELNLERKGYYTDYDININPTIANAFGAAAFRFGHSLVQNSFVRSDSQHRPLFNNVSLHEEQENIENIWSFGSIDRLLLGFSNQPSQKRDEFICDELTNHLFQSSGIPFGMDLAAINIQRGRDHGIPSYTSWRQPCGLSKIKNWNDLNKLMNIETVHRLKSLYHHYDDIDLFSGGLAEKPVRGGIVGPTFACIIAQQFLNLRKGDRFWYENDGFISSFTPAQLQQLRHVTFAQILCQTMNEIETIQPFVFLMADNFRNIRLPCNSPMINNFDLTAWIEKQENEIDSKFDFDSMMKKEIRNERSRKKKTRKRQTTTTTTTNKPYRTTKTKQRKTTPKPTKIPLKITITNVTTNSVKIENKYSDDIPKRPTFIHYYGQFSYNRRTTTTVRSNYYDKNDDVTYLFGIVPENTTPASQVSPQTPLEVNIKIQYFVPTTQRTEQKKKRPTNYYEQNNNQQQNNYQQNNNEQNNYQQNDNEQNDYQQNSYQQNNYNDIYSTTKPTKNPEISYPIFVQQSNYNTLTTKRPTVNNGYNDDFPTTNNNNNRPDIRPYRPTYDYNNNIKTTTTTKRTYFVRPQQTYYENRPFSTSNRPYVYKPNKNHYIYSDYYYSTTNRPQQSNDGTFYNNYHYQNRPSFGHQSTTYNRDDSTPDRDQTRPITTTQEDKLTADIINDKLDFQTHLVSVNKRRPNFNDNKFVKISSIKGVSTVNTDLFYYPQVKEGDLELPDDHDVDNKKSDDEEEEFDDEIRIVDIDVEPSEIDEERWLVYNATDEQIPLLQVPDIVSNSSCSNELPRPISFQTYLNQNNSISRLVQDDNNTVTTTTADTTSTTTTTELLLATDSTTINDKT